MSLNFLCLATFYVFPLMSAATDSPIVESVESIFEQLQKNLGKGGSTSEDINGLLQQFNDVQIQNDLLKKEIISLKKEITSLQTQRTPWNTNKRTGDTRDSTEVSFNCSPFNQQSLIYTMYITDQDNKSLIPQPLRLDATKLSAGPINEENLFKASLEVEEHLLKIIQKNPQFVERVMYVGLTEGTLQNRFRGHWTDYQDPVKKNSLSKVIQIERALESLFNVKVSYLIANVPKNYLDYFECLVSDIFLAQEKGGSARIGTRDAWEKYLTYKNSPERKDYLSEKKLIDVVKNIAIDLFNRKINFTPRCAQEEPINPEPNLAVPTLVF